MDKEEAKRILLRSVLNLQERRGDITIGDLEAEVINNACLYILKNQKEHMSKSKSIEEIFLSALNSVTDFVPYAQAFTEAAMELFPRHYTENEAIIANLGIQQNIAWEGMWDHLRNYFQKNHGLQIDNVETTPTTFYSTNHKRFENNTLISESDVARTINLSFIDNKQEIIVSIEPSLSPKKAYLISNENRKLKYKGYDPDYLFIITLDEFKEIEIFTLEMPNRNLKIMYFE